MPDYIGYGVTEDRIHPYLHGALTAQNSVDMLLSAMPVLDSLNANIPLDSIYIVGFSQGGAAAVWILKLLEEQYSDRIHVRKCFAGSGPYDVAVTYDEAVMRNKITLPMIVPMLVLGTSEAYNLNLQPDDFLTPAMQRTYLRYIKDKNIGVIPMFFRTPNHRLSHWMTEAGMDKTTPLGSDLYQGLIRSSLVHYSICADSDSICPIWTPKAPLYIFHSYNDDVVSFRCAEHFHRRYADLPQITWDFGSYGSHLTSLRRFLTTVRKLLSEDVPR